MGSAVVVHRARCLAACGISLDQGLSSCPPYWQTDANHWTTWEGPGSVTMINQIIPVHPLSDWAHGGHSAYRAPLCHSQHPSCSGTPVSSFSQCELSHLWGGGRGALTSWGSHDGWLYCDIPVLEFKKPPYFKDKGSLKSRLSLPPATAPFSSISVALPWPQGVSTGGVCQLHGFGGWTFVS